MSRNITVADGLREEEAVLKLSLSSESDKDVTYTFLLVSPDGDLRWEGKLEKNGSFYYSDALGITQSARFEEGEYSLFVYSSMGTSIEKKIPLQKEEGDYTFENASGKNDAEVIYYDREGFEVDEDEESDRAVIRYSDRYSNSITLTVEFNV